MDNFDLRKYLAEGKQDKEDTSKAKELADRVLNIASEGIMDLNWKEHMEFRALIAQSFDMKDEENLPFDIKVNKQ